MDPEGRHGSFLSASSLLLLLAGLGGWLLYDQPLTSLRPATPKAFERGNSVSEDVEARLWQDPFRPAYEHRESLRSQLGSHPEDEDSPHRAHQLDHQILTLARQIRNRIDAQKGTEKRALLLLPVLLRGGPYAEAAETRRRWRKAVLAGLSVAKFAPERDEWLGYFEWPLPLKQGGGKNHAVIPYEWLHLDPDPASADPGNDLVVAPDTEYVLILWLDENDYATNTLGSIARLLGELLGHLREGETLQHRPGSETGEEDESRERERLGRVRLALLGPASSTTLLAMLEDQSRSAQNPKSGDGSGQIEDSPQPSTAQLVGGLIEITEGYLDCGLAHCPGPPPRGLGVLSALRRQALAPGAPPETELDLPEVASREKLAEALSDTLEKVNWQENVVTIEREPLKKTLAEQLPVRDSNPSWPTEVTARWRQHLADSQITIEWSEDLLRKERIHRLPEAAILENLDIFSSRATADEKRILKRLPTVHEGRSLAQVMKETTGADFFRTITTDDQLAKALVEELCLRNVRPSRPDSKDHVVLISEWDTFYGRELPRALGGRLEHELSEDCRLSPEPYPDGPHLQGLRNRVHRYSYLRGMDGAVPGQADSEHQSRGGASQKAPPPPYLGTELLMVNAEELERPMGPGQLDDMRRLADKIEGLEKRLARKGEAIRAIGVLGSDVYDKQLVLQALQRRFPRALFFTTDLDARLFHPSEFHWSRNLLIASSFGLELREELQGPIPPFRDSYQTATFLATLLALDGSRTAEESVWQRCQDPRRTERSEDGGGEGSPLPSDIGSCLKPRLFEVARSGAYPLDRLQLEAGREEPQLHVRPPDQGDVPWLRRHLGLLGFLISLALLGVLVVPLNSRILHQLKPTDLHGVRRWRPIHRALAVSALAFAGLIALIVADMERAGGEPFDLWNGLSAWPTELLRLVAFALSVLFLAVATERLRDNRQSLSKTYGLPLPSEGNPSSLTSRAREVLRRMRRLDRWGRKYGIETGWGKRLGRQLALLRRMRRWLSIHHWQSSTRGRDLQEEQLDAGRIWRRYSFLGRPAHRLIRLLPWAFLFMVCGRILVILYPPNRPLRGGWSMLADDGVLFLSVLGLTLLTFFVVDATRLCQSFIDALANRRTSWPDETRQGAATRRGMRPEDMDDFLDLRMIADRSEVVGRLVLYPFIVLFVMILSRSTLFDRWDWPVSLILIMVSLGGLAVWCALALRRAAETARSQAVDRLKARLSRAHTDGDEGGARIEQLRLLIEEVENLRRGAFSHWSRHPVLQAFLLPFGGLGLVTLVEILGTLGL